MAALAAAASPADTDSPKSADAAIESVASLNAWRRRQQWEEDSCGLLAHSDSLHRHKTLTGEATIRGNKRRRESRARGA